jgi:plasmid stabilization system protein ParE
VAVSVVTAPEAEQDIADAYAWYEERRSGLGEEFLSSVDAGVEAIRRTPAMHGPVFLGFRRALIRRFPYALFYEYVRNTVTVYAVFHMSRHPLRWQQRLSSIP